MTKQEVVEVLRASVAPLMWALQLQRWRFTIEVLRHGGRGESVPGEAEFRTAYRLVFITLYFDHLEDADDVLRVLCHEMLHTYCAGFDDAAKPGREGAMTAQHEATVRRIEEMLNVGLGYRRPTEFVAAAKETLRKLDPTGRLLQSLHDRITLVGVETPVESAPF